MKTTTFLAISVAALSLLTLAAGQSSAFYRHYYPDPIRPSDHASPHVPLDQEAIQRAAHKAADWDIPLDSQWWTNTSPAWWRRVSPTDMNVPPSWWRIVPGQYWTNVPTGWWLSTPPQWWSNVSTQQWMEVSPAWWTNLPPAWTNRPPVEVYNPRLGNP